MPLPELVFFFLIIIPSAIIHEYAHGAVADKLGDPTARYAGRLTLNPLAHIDLFGTILLPLFLMLMRVPILFAYAKPVPFNPYNLRAGRMGPVLVGLAGPAANFSVAIIFGLIIRLTHYYSTTPLLPTPLVLVLSIIVYANILLAVFNLVPIPPLDGSKIFYALIPDRYEGIKLALERYGFLILLLFIFSIGRVIQPIIGFLYALIVGQGRGVF